MAEASPSPRAEGRTCRDAVIRGARRVSDLTAHYEGSVSVPVQAGQGQETEVRIVRETEENGEGAENTEEGARDENLRGRLAAAAKALTAFLRVHRIFTVNLALIALLLALCGGRLKKNTDR